MTIGNRTWFRRRRWVVLGSVAAVILIAGGVSLTSAVRQARIAARRMQDL
jgi:hypothetical protein